MTKKLLHNHERVVVDSIKRWRVEGGEVLERVYYTVEPVVLGPDGFVAFENPSRAQLEKAFSPCTF